MPIMRNPETLAWLRARVCGVLLLLAMVLFGSGVALMSRFGDAGALSGATGPVNVTVAPTSGLTDGQVVTIDAQTTTGTLTEIAAHICLPDQSIDNNAMWLFQGPFCTNVAPGAGDFSKSVVLGSTASGSLTFKAGVTPPEGISWVDEQGSPHSITCDATHSCDLVVRFQHSTDTYFFTAPLTYAGSGETTTTAPDTTTTTSPATTTTGPATTTTTSPGTTTTTAPVSTTTTVAGPLTVSPTQGPPGAAISITSDTWKAASEVTVTFNSEPIELGKLTATQDGKVQGTFAVPAGVAVGAHTITLTGTGADDQSQTLTQAFTVVAPASTATTVAGVATNSSGSGSTGSSSPLAFTGASTRDMASVALLFLAAGFLCLDVSIRRRAQA
jgi:hypothetical protein